MHRFDFRKNQSLAATCSHLLQPLAIQPLADWQFGSKWLLGQVTAGGCKWVHWEWLGSGWEVAGKRSYKASGHLQSSIKHVWKLRTRPDTVGSKMLVIQGQDLRAYHPRCFKLRTSSSSIASKMVECQGHDLTP